VLKTLKASKKRPSLPLLAEGEKLRDADVQLLEVVAAHRVRWQVMLVVTVARLAIDVDTIRLISQPQPGKML